MKNKQLLMIALFAVFFAACSNDNEFESQTDSAQDEISRSGAIEVGSDGSLPDSIFLSLEADNPDLYSFDDPHSELWVDESDTKTRALSGTLRVYGYDEVRYVNNYKTYFSNGLAWDSRVAQYKNTIFLANIKLYVKRIRIPKGATLILPPQYIMNSMTNMGRHPIGSSTSQQITTGYAKKFYTSSFTEDVYELITEAVSISHNIEGRQIFNPPVYMPQAAKNGPSNFEFKYQYDYISWN